MKLPKPRLSYGVGTCARGKWLVTNPDGSMTKEKNLWKSMLERCYSPRYQATKPTYVGCTVANEFLDFQAFMAWAELQVGFGKDGFRLDKDILLKGNKVYSPETCCFVPHQLNSLFIKKNANRGAYPIGVHEDRGKFIAQCSHDGVREYLGWYDAPGEAFAVYKAAKEHNVKRLATFYKDQISPAAYDALMKYEVEITD